MAVGLGLYLGYATCWESYSKATKGADKGSSLIVYQQPAEFGSSYILGRLGMVCGMHACCVHMQCMEDACMCTHVGLRHTCARCPSSVGWRSPPSDLNRSQPISTDLNRSSPHRRRLLRPALLTQYTYVDATGLHHLLDYTGLHYLLAHLFTYLLACLLTYLLTYLLAYLLTYLLACSLTYSLTCLLTCLLEECGGRR